MKAILDAIEAAKTAHPLEIGEYLRHAHDLAATYPGTRFLRRALRCGCLRWARREALLLLVTAEGGERR